MTPAAPVPHVCRPTPARSKLGRLLERAVAPIVAAALIAFAVAGWAATTGEYGQAATIRRPAAVRVFDSFTRANSSTVIGSTELGSCVWVPGFGLQGIYAPDGGHLYLPGAAGLYASAPDSAALSLTVDGDWRALVALNDWTPAGLSYFAAKYAYNSAARSYRFGVNTTGNLILVLSNDGTATATATATATLGSLGIIDGQLIWVRATYRKSDRRVQFWIASGAIANPVTADWQQVGANVTHATTTIFDSAAVLQIGNDGEALTPTAGKFRRVQIRSNVLDDGTGIVFDADFAKQPAAARTLVEDSANAATVTINNGAWGVNGNQGYASSAFAFNHATVETRLSDVEVRTTWGAAVDGSGIVLRQVDSRNYLTYLRVGAAVGLYKIVDGAAAGMAGSAATPVGGVEAVGDVVRVVARGPNVLVYRNDVLIGYAQDWTFANATRHGLIANGVNTARYDDFQVKAAA